MNDSRQKAKDALINCFAHCWPGDGGDWSTERIAKIDEITDLIIDATVYEIKAQFKKAMSDSNAVFSALGGGGSGYAIVEKFIDNKTKLSQNE
jgi:hypothetical protein